MDQLKEEKIKEFAALGVAEKDIFKEIVRARYLDYEIFSNAKNLTYEISQYGISQADLHAAAKRLTNELFGPVPEDMSTFIAIYSLALSVDPMLFAEGALPVSPMTAAVLAHAIERAKEGKTVLFAGADRYMRRLTDVFVGLRTQNVAVAMADVRWKDPVEKIYTRCRAMLEDELYDDPLTYDHIFYAGEDTEASAALWAKLHSLLAENGKMDALFPDSFLRSESEEIRKTLAEVAKSCRVASFCHVTDGEEEMALLTSEASQGDGRITFCEAEPRADAFKSEARLAMARADFAEAASWDFDLYAYNGNPSLQTIFAAGLLDPDFAVGSAFKAVPALRGTMGTYRVVSAEAVEPSGVREDLVTETVISDAAHIAAGDLVVTVKEDELVSAVAGEALEGSAAGAGVWVFRPVAEYTAEYLKVYLDGPIGKLLASVMKTNAGLAVSASRILRLPLRRADEERIELITMLVARTTKKLAAAEADWRRAKRDSVGLMMNPDRGD